MSAAGEVRMPCRVLVVHSSDELYGADRMLLLLAGSLDRQAYSMTVVVPTDLDYEGRLTARLRDAGVTVVRMNLAVLRRSYLRPRRRNGRRSRRGSRSAAAGGGRRRASGPRRW